MTAIQTVNHGAPVAWQQEMVGAQYLLRSGLCPTALKTPEAVLFVILAGRDLGLSPVAALRNISVIQGKVELAADLQLALFHRAGGRSAWKSLTNTEAVLSLEAPWSLAPHTSRWTIEDAKTAGLSSGDNWKKYPKAMLRSRAITSALKDIGFDATAGVCAPGEISGEETEPGEVVEIVTQPIEPVPDPGPVLPGKPESWGGFGGTPIRDCGLSVLEGFVAWVLKDETRMTRYGVEFKAAEDRIATAGDAAEPEAVEA